VLPDQGETLVLPQVNLSRLAQKPTKTKLSKAERRQHAEAATAAALAANAAAVATFVGVPQPAGSTPTAEAGETVDVNSSGEAATVKPEAVAEPVPAGGWVCTYTIPHRDDTLLWNVE